LVSVVGFIDRSLEETNVYSGTTYASSTLDTTYGFEVERRISSNLTLNGRAAYTRSAFQNFDRLDEIIDAGAGLRYYVSPQVFVGADFRIIDRNSQEPVDQYSRNQLMFNVGYTPARSKDYSIIPELGAPDAPAVRGTQAGFYAGAQVGYGALTTRTAGPRGGGGSDTGDFGNFGGSYGAFAGWGQEFGNWYLGLEVDANDSNANWYHSKNKGDSRTMHVDKDASYSASVRAGYLLEGGLVYGKLGMASTDFHTYYTENQSAGTGAFDQDQTETGTRWGMGLEMSASPDLFVRMDYSFTRYDQYDVPYFDSTASGVKTVTEKFDLRDNLFSIGLGYRFGGERPAVAKRSASELNGPYAGASLGHGTLNTQLTGLHRDGGGGPYEFTGDFANSGGTGGFFVGYGYTYGQIYLGAEAEAETANFGWYHERETSGGGGRDFSVEKHGSTGAGVRLGYVLGNGGLLYGRIGQVRSRFYTTYVKGNNSAEWIARSDEKNGTRVGLGAELLASASTFVRMDYSYTDYDSYGFVTGHGGGTNADEMTFNNHESLFRLGLGFRF
jgi:opacity protein-like surface antigen